ncbi:MAG TPA: ABC transporter permease [Terriglobales bacterium]|jgi:putative ABC transport system permease protein|nr:ABC transporter permease [Terriglobales bacterium]
MSFTEVLRQTFATLRAHKLRSFLTMFGIIWGIASVILLVGLGKGFSKDQKDRMKNLGTDLVVIWGGRTSGQAGGLAAGREIRLSVDDARAIKSECYMIKTVSPELRRAVAEASQWNQANRAVRGVWPEYQRFRSLKVEEGRLMVQEDEDQMRRVVLLGFEARQQLYPGKPAIGEMVTMNGVPYTVIGVLERKKQNSSYGSGPDNTQLFVPYSAMARDFPPPEKPWNFKGWINNMVVEVADPEQHTEAVAQVYRVLGRRHHFDPQDEDALMVWDTMRGAKMVTRIFDIMTVFFGAMALMTLCLGGIGVMNIMLISVTERTREIGVRKAMGATRRDILRQFFTEAIVLATISGLAGLGVGVGIAVLMGIAPKPDFIPSPVISPVSIFGSMAMLGIITVLAGMYPARRAAEMEPVDSLRYE